MVTDPPRTESFDYVDNIKVWSVEFLFRHSCVEGGFPSHSRSNEGWAIYCELQVWYAIMHRFNRICINFECDSYSFSP